MVPPHMLVEGVLLYQHTQWHLRYQWCLRWYLWHQWYTVYCFLTSGIFLEVVVSSPTNTTRDHLKHHRWYSYHWW